MGWCEINRKKGLALNRKEIEYLGLHFWLFIVRFFVCLFVLLGWYVLPKAVRSFHCSGKLGFTCELR